MTATQMTQKKFQRIDIDALEHLLKIEAEHEEPVQTSGFLGFIKSLLNRFAF